MKRNVETIVVVAAVAAVQHSRPQWTICLALDHRAKTVLKQHVKYHYSPTHIRKRRKKNIIDNQQQQYNQRTTHTTTATKMKDLNHFYQYLFCCLLRTQRKSHTHGRRQQNLKRKKMLMLLLLLWSIVCMMNLVWARSQYIESFWSRRYQPYIHFGFSSGH